MSPATGLWPPPHTPITWQAGRWWEPTEVVPLIAPPQALAPWPGGPPGNCQAHLLIGTGAENQRGVRHSFLRSHGEVLLPRRREGLRPGKRPWVPAGFQQPWSRPLPLWAPFPSGGGAVVSVFQGPAGPRLEC